MFGKPLGELYAPVAGSAVPVAQAPDPAFSENLLGYSVGIIPTEGKAFAPCDATVDNMFHTGHAVTLVSGEGAEILIHIGLDTVNLNGKHFTINSKETDLKTEVRKLFPEGVDFVLDAAGFPSIINQGMTLIKDRGAVLAYGVPEKEEITIDFSQADYNWRVIYQQMPRKREEGAAHEQVMQWIREGKLVIK